MSKLTLTDLKKQGLVLSKSDAQELHSVVSQIAQNGGESEIVFEGQPAKTEPAAKVDAPAKEAAPKADAKPATPAKTEPAAPASPAPATDPKP